MTVYSTIVLAFALMIVAVSSIARQQAWRRREQSLWARIDQAHSDVAFWQKNAADWKEIARIREQSSKKFQQSSGEFEQIATQMIRATP